MTDGLSIQIVVEEDAVVVVLPRPMNWMHIVWQEAMRFGEEIELAADESPAAKSVFNPVAVNEESAGVRLAKDARGVVIFFGHTSQLRFQPEAARMVGRRIKKMAMNTELAIERDIHMVYTSNGAIKKIVGPNYTQIVRG